MKRSAALLFALACAAAAAGEAPSPAVPTLPEFRAVYGFERGRISIGETVLQLERSQDDIYRYSSEARATGFIAMFIDDVIREESIFRYDGGQFWPISYQYRQLNSDKNRNEDIVYDWTERRAEVNYRGHESRHELAPGMLDRFLLQLALSVHARGGALDREYQVLDNGRVKRFTLRGDSLRQIRTDAGTFEALCIERADRDPDKALRLWLAPALNWLPVRIEQEKRNEEPLRLVLKEMELTGPAAAAPAPAADR